MTRESRRVLFVDDEQSMRFLVQNELPRMGFQPTVCGDLSEARACLEENAFDAAIVDLRLPDGSGLDLLEALNATQPPTPAIILTGHASTDSAIAALRGGAVDFLTKPTQLVEIQAVLERVAQRETLARKTRALEGRLAAAEGPAELVGQSAVIRDIDTLVTQVAAADVPVLITGETGTGKDLIARLIHLRSARGTMPYVPVNCGAIPQELAESELFGHRKGAFTGADHHRAGLAEMADGGTLFLDEIGELPVTLQPKLLRFLETGELRRLGEDRARHINVRLVSATNRDVAAALKSGDLREDLYYRINVFEIHLPPLRERVADVVPLVEHFAARIATRTGWPVSLSPEAVAMLERYAWPGNVRQLANVIEHATVLSQGDPIEPRHLGPLTTPDAAQETALRTLRDWEWHHIQQALRRHDGNKSTAAEELGISLKTLYNKFNAMRAND